MTGIWWTSASIEIFLCSLTATTAHLLMSLGQTLFHRYLGHRGIGGRFFENHLYIHHGHYSGDHVVSENYLNEDTAVRLTEGSRLWKPRIPPISERNGVSTI
jgi:hypothetical protein